MSKLTRWQVLIAGVDPNPEFWTMQYRLKQLEEENRNPKFLVPDLTLDKHMLQEVITIHQF